MLVEQFIAGRELAIGLLGNGNPEVLPIVEIDLDGDPNAIQTDSNKLRTPRGKLCPAPLTDEQTADLQELAKRAFRSLELYDFARVDIRLDADLKPYILEINSMDSLGLTGTYAHSAQTAGYSYDAMVNRMLDVAAIRYFGAERLADDRRIYGAGAAETKGGIAVALAALRGLRHIRRLRQLRVAILLTSDGAASGSGGSQLIEAASARARNVIGLKSGDPNGALITARAGEHQFDVDMRCTDGSLPADDLALIPWPIVRSPSRRSYRGVTLATMLPPPSICATPCSTTSSPETSPVATQSGSKSKASEPCPPAGT